MSRRQPSPNDLLWRPPFAQLSKGEFRLLERLWAAIPVAPGTVVAHEGRPCREFAVVVDGIARVTRDGREIVLLQPGQYFGEVGIVRAVPNPVTIVACTAMTLEVMGVREFRSAYATMPAFRDHIDHQIRHRAPTWLGPMSPASAPHPVPLPGPADDGDYTLAS